MPLRIRIKKPVDGETEVEFDDSKGLTGYHRFSGRIPLSELTSTLDEGNGEYHRRRALINEARRGRPV